MPIAVVEPMVRLILLIVEGVLHSPNPRRELERRIEAELAHKAAQEAAKRVLDGEGQ